MAGPFRVTYTWTLEDFNVLCDAYTRLTKGRRGTRAVHFVIDGLLLVCAAFFAWTGDWLLAAYFAMLLLLLICLEFLVKPWLRRRQFDNQHLGDNPITFTADEDGMTTSSALGDGRHFWKAIRHVDDLPEHVILWPNNRMGFLVPKRAFASPQDADAFVALAKEKTVGQAL